MFDCDSGSGSCATPKKKIFGDSFVKPSVASSLVLTDGYSSGDCATLHTNSGPGFCLAAGVVPLPPQQHQRQLSLLQPLFPSTRLP